MVIINNYLDSFQQDLKNIGPIKCLHKLAQMEKLLKSESGTDEWGYNKVLKLRIMQATYNQLAAIQEKRGICMAELLRRLIYESMEKEFTDTEEKPT